MKIKQVVVTGQNQVELQTLELEPQDLGPDELLIETEWSFISAGTELANYTGKEPKVFQPGTWCAYPWKSGYANVGLVRAVGERVTRVAPGERVFTYGPHASAFRYNRQRLVIPTPAGIAPDIAAASRMAGVSLSAVLVAEIRGAPWVAVFGLGAVGNLAAQAFAARGCRVIGVDPVAARRALAERCGVDQTIGGSPEAVQAAITDLTGGALANITVDAVGHSAVVSQALKATASHGQHIILGTPRVPVEGDLTDLLADIHLRWITVRGALEWFLPMYSDHGETVSQHSKQELIFDWLRRGKLHLEPLISHRLKPEQIKEAYEGLLRQPETYTGVALDWRASP
jgi:2-desacetyl-2-hydroxyethyl bacteriochlorophyllide A dehydrogenase